MDKSRRFTGLSGYKKVLESGVEALVIEDVPGFYPEQAQAAVAAGCHVYMAKPIAVDVPGCLAIEALGKLATAKKLCFLVDYQMPTDPVNIEVAQRVREGGLGKIGFMATFGFCGGFGDPPLTATIESRLRRYRYHRGRTAHSLGVTREWLWAKMRKLGLVARDPGAQSDDEPDEPR